MTHLSLPIPVAIVCILALMLAAGFPSRASAGVSFTVNSTADAVDAVPGDGRCATLAGKCTLRAAVQETNALPGADAITVPGGMYRLALPQAGLDDATGDLDVSDHLRITGAGAGVTIIDAGDLDRVFQIGPSLAGVRAEISGLTAQNGTAAGAGGITVLAGSSLTLANSVVRDNTSGIAGGIGNLGELTVINSMISGNSTATEGGGIASPGTLTVIDSTFSNNIAGGLGGGIAAPPGSTVAVSGSTFTNNLATGGGGIAAAGSFSLTNSVITGNSSRTNGGGVGHLGTGGAVTDSTISGNSAVADGGGITNGGPLTVTNSTISGNSAGADGGGIFNPAPVTLTLTNSSVIGNSAAGFAGGVFNGGTLTVTGSIVNSNSSNAVGGIFNPGIATVIDSSVSGNTSRTDAGGIGNPTTGRLMVVDSTISDNEAALLAGGIANPGGTVTVSDSTISGNSAEFGGGFGGGGAIMLNNSTFSGNSSRTDGGGLAIIGPPPVAPALNSVTITNNTADSDGDGIGDGGGIATPAPLSVSNTIIAGNRSFGGQAPDCKGPIASQGYNLIESTTGCTIMGDTTGNITGQDANLGPLAYSGGTTQTHALLPGSPAIDAGNPTTLGSGANVCEPMDQRGVNRPQDGDGNGQARCDIGSFEVGIFPSTAGKVTGGGSIASASGGEAGFGFRVKANNGGVPAGGLLYVDESAGIEVSNASFHQLTINGTQAEFSGTALVNGVSRPFRVTVSDMGEPGTADTFSIEVLGPGGYADSGTLTGGNVQVH